MTQSTPQNADPTAPLDAELVQALTEAVDAEFETTLATLTDLVAHGGIAWDSFDRQPLERSAQAVERLVKEAGLQDVRVVTETREDGQPGGPAILGQRPAAAGKPTVLLYAHHDVQPVGDEALWDTPPFEATRRGDRLYGRGAADDKAGIMVHLAAVKALQSVMPEAGVGVRVFIEGEEEAGSPTFRAFLENQKDDLAADAIVVADSANWAVGEPALTTSLRGVADGTVTVRVLDHSVHSGMFGGPVLDALTLLSRLIATLHDENGVVAVPGVGARTHADVDYSEQTYRADAGVLDGVRLAGDGSLADRLWNGPALSIIGIDAPSVDESSNTIQSVARAKWSLRVGPGVDPEQAYEAVTTYLSEQSEAVLGAQISFERGHFGQPFSTDTSDPMAAAMMGSFEQAWGVAPKATGLGGSIPFTADLAEVFPEATILITGVEDPDSRAHSANESLHVGDFRNAILAEALWLARLSR
ncbi:dipeptidase [Micrococcus cohnii]|uniref:Acetylornithine deacetylase/succinyl-diaminopimelate desuccinylase-like protein n=1 Tax=Micrococcus cohnii TaxID=993416 RepID=A0A7W7GNF7_9MICC|nr:dipeptidase [Micrococcus cohnii]MBB4735296.1 acetylornithine deacetylase/succinyl-diaminopimelate desuccinylase-like protein [Micrococcus cohnii]